jgi:hypothetical protein
MSGKTTRTLNPLHFEDLEPHRFEDMVRQLAYDFRAWRRIEATGRLGSDEGMDIRAIEGTEEVDDSDDAENPVHSAERSRDRLWIIQCKREKEIGPTKVRKIIAQSLKGAAEVPYGFILSAACDFSKKTRDAFHEELKKRGIQEGHVWGKADLEDVLFLPKYDHLLFAYFNISLQVRRRSLQTELRSRLAMKRKLVSVLGGVEDAPDKPVLLRDPRDDRYPRGDRKGAMTGRPRWKYFTFVGHQPPDHLCFVTKKCFAYVDDEGTHWDALLDHNDERPLRMSRRDEMPSAEEDEKRSRYWTYWLEKIPEKNRAWFTVYRCVHYDRILAVDEHGDVENEGPHVLVEFDPKHGPFEGWDSAVVEWGPLHFTKRLRAEGSTRMKFFPESIPQVDRKLEASERGST